ncbi:MAG: hypothetical protein JWM53_4031 [bacterium]|nr:hypothetical protein [bacterium]
MRTRSVVAVAALVSACGASPRYTYRPIGEIQNVPGGDVRVATLGVTTTKLPAGKHAREARTLHVRMVVHNGGGEVWTVDGIDQRATINGSLHETPVLARCDGDAMPLAVLMPGDTRTIDLYYELPPPLVDAAAIPSVQIDWRVATPPGVLARETSAFERHDVPPPPIPAPDPRKLSKQLAQSRRALPSWRN